MIRETCYFQQFHIDMQLNYVLTCACVGSEGTVDMIQAEGNF